MGIVPQSGYGPVLMKSLNSVEGKIILLFIDQMVELRKGHNRLYDEGKNFFSFLTSLNGEI